MLFVLLDALTMAVSNPINIFVINQNIFLYHVSSLNIYVFDNITIIKSSIINKKIVHTPI